MCRSTAVLLCRDALCGSLMGGWGGVQPEAGPLAASGRPLAKSSAALGSACLPRDGLWPSKPHKGVGWLVGWSVVWLVGGDCLPHAQADYSRLAALSWPLSSRCDIWPYPSGTRKATGKFVPSVKRPRNISDICISVDCAKSQVSCF